MKEHLVESFKCDNCGMVTHSAVKPKKCPLCGASIRKIGYLKRCGGKTENVITDSLKE